jgi:hypothetical protein
VTSKFKLYQSMKLTTIQPYQLPGTILKMWNIKKIIISIILNNVKNVIISIECIFFSCKIVDRSTFFI